VNGGGSDGERIHKAFMLALSRPPDAEELEWVQRFLDDHRDGGEDAGAELHAWMLLCRALLNLDETITKS